MKNKPRMSDSETMCIVFPLMMGVLIATALTPEPYNWLPALILLAAILPPLAVSFYRALRDE